MERPRLLPTSATDEISSIGFSMMLNRFTGTGRVGLQSMYLHMPSE